MRLRACAFDLGNTLINDTELQAAAIEDLARDLARRELLPSADRFISTYLTINHTDDVPFRSHTFGDVDFFSATLHRMTMTAIQPEELLSLYRRSIRRRTKRDPLVVEAIEYLRANGLKTALISNESTDRVEAYLEDTRTRELFDAVVVSESVQVEKPDARIFRIAMEMLDCVAEEAAMFGDNEIADGACKRIGMKFVHVVGFKHVGWGWERGDHFTPDFVIDRVEMGQLRQLLKEITNGEDCHG